MYTRTADFPLTLDNNISLLNDVPNMCVIYMNKGGNIEKIKLEKTYLISKYISSSQIKFKKTS